MAFGRPGVTASLCVDHIVFFTFLVAVYCLFARVLKSRSHPMSTPPVVTNRSLSTLLLLIALCLVCDAVPPAAAQADFTINTVEPAIHPLEGGSRVRILGSSFASGMHVYISTTQVSGVERFSSSVFRFLTPPMAEGTYDMRVVHPTGGELLFQQAIQFAPRKLAPVESLSCTVDPGNSVAVLQWASHTVRCDSDQP